MSGSAERSLCVCRLTIGVITGHHSVAGTYHPHAEVNSQVRCPSTAIGLGWVWDRSPQHLCVSERSVRLEREFRTRYLFCDDPGGPRFDHITSSGCQTSTSTARLSVDHELRDGNARANCGDLGAGILRLAAKKTNYAIGASDDWIR